MKQELSESAVGKALSTRWLGRSYRYFVTVDSTNTALGAELEDDFLDPPAGTVFLAEYQAKGRGRLDRRWLAPPYTSLLMSILFRPDWPPMQNHWLTMMASLAAIEAMEAVTELTLGVKWPNDIVTEVGSEWHKVSGLLLEGSFGADGQLEGAILGIGMNVNIPSEQLPEADTPATSLMVVTGRPIDRLSLLVDFLQRLETYYEAAKDGKSPQPAWKRRLITLERKVKVTNLGSVNSVTGLAVDTDQWGQLLVRDDTGKLHTVSAGDVTLREDVQAS